MEEEAKSLTGGHATALSMGVAAAQLVGSNINVCCHRTQGLLVQPPLQQYVMQGAQAAS
jgi:hypothetical protein